jgi:cysteinyl-tRNA synthetase
MVKLFNTLSREKEEFISINPGIVNLYCCGPTVYNYQHIGNYRTFLFEDNLKRVLIYNGYDVRHVMNITDVGHLVSDEDEGDDKMEKGAEREGRTVWEIAEHYTEDFFNDIKLLNILPADEFPKATQYIPEQIEMIKCLEEKGYTYITGDGVYFDTSKFPHYSELAKLDIKGLQEGKRVEFSSEKKNITDFALWKFSPKDKQRQMEWDSPWGKGFPGWHIECSAMSRKFFGDTIDIHCGGVDHIPVHHTNEKAQSECCTGKRFVNYWLHGEFLITDKKMSKSSGEFLRLKTLTDRGYSPLDYRYFCIMTHYRKKLKFSFEGLDAARNGYESLKNKIKELKKEVNEGPETIFELSTGSIAMQLKDRFTEAVNDDLNLGEGLAVLWEAVKSSELGASEKLALAYDFDKVLAIDLKDITIEKTSETEIPEDVLELVEQRKEAKSQKDFKLADELRNRIKEMGYEVVDKKEGAEVKSISAIISS